MTRNLFKSILLFLLLQLPQAAWSADDFTYLDWDVLRIDSVLPYYTEVVPLESDYRANDYQVRIDYPEYRELTAAESGVASRYDSLVGERIEVESSVGVQRKRGMLDISFIPVIRRQGKYLKLVSAKITIIPKAKNVPLRARVSSGERYAMHSVLASGRWVKISITDDGMYSLTRSALRRMGFSKPENVHLYGYGGHLQSERIDPEQDYDDLKEIPLVYSGQTDSWLFWGNGLLYWNGDVPVKNHYANMACYFLTESEVPNSIQTLPAPSAGNPRVTSVTAGHVLYEKDDFAWYRGGRELYDSDNFKGSGQRSYHLSVPHYSGSGRLTTAFTAAAPIQSTVTPKVNGKTLSSIRLDGLSDYNSATKSVSNQSAPLDAGGDALNVELMYSLAVYDAHLDYLAYNYDRKLAFEKGFVAFQSTSGATRFCFDKAVPSGAQVLRIGTSVREAALITTERYRADASSEDCLSVVVDEAGGYVCFDPSYAYPHPQVIGEVRNQDLHQMSDIDMLIIIPASGKLQAQAQRLVDIHAQYDTLRMAIVRADEIYNEFSSGTPDATAYRRFLKMLYDRAASDKDAPRYLLLFGDCAWDNRMLSSSWKRESPDDYLLCYQSENSLSATKSYVMEDYFGFLDDSEGTDFRLHKVDLGVGRFPVTTASEAKIMVDKVESFLSGSNAGSWRNMVVMMGDDGDGNEHMDYSNRVAEAIIERNPAMDVKKVMWDAYRRVSNPSYNAYPEVETLIRKQMKDGALVMNYTGHGNPISLSHEYVLRLGDYQTETGNRQPLWVTAACDIMPFDGREVNIGETAVLNANGGAVAFFGTTRTVYGSQNFLMNRGFMRYLFSTDEQGARYRIGDALRLAKCDIVAGGLDKNFYENKFHFALLGDPSLILGAPRRRLVLDRINDREINGSIQLKAGEKVVLSGHVEDEAGAVVVDCNAEMSVKLFDSSEQVTCKNNAGTANLTPFTYDDRTSILYQSTDSVRGGQFSLSFVVPMDIRYSNESGRFVFYAYDTEHHEEMNGYFEDFVLGGASDDLSDKEGPQIFAYLGSDDFQNGDKVSAEPYFMATLEDVSGISVSGSGVGHNLSLCVDGSSERTYNLNDYYSGETGDFTRGSVAFTIPELSDGKHTLTFRAWDVLNNMSETSLDFVVDSSLKPHILQLSATQNPARTSTNFVVCYDRPGALCTITIDVYNFMGQRVWTTTEVGSQDGGIYHIPWNLCTPSGGRLGSGIYLYRCTLQSGHSKNVTKTQKIVILNNK